MAFEEGAAQQGDEPNEVRAGKRNRGALAGYPQCSTDSRDELPLVA
jgi:hypothetical protein